MFEKAFSSSKHLNMEDKQPQLMTREEFLKSTEKPKQYTPVIPVDYNAIEAGNSMQSADSPATPPSAGVSEAEQVDDLTTNDKNYTSKDLNDILFTFAEKLINTYNDYNYDYKTVARHALKEVEEFIKEDSRFK